MSIQDTVLLVMVSRQINEFALENLIKIVGSLNHNKW